MALFYYQALERNGRKTKGMIEAIPRVMPVNCCAVKTSFPCTLKPG